MERSARVGQQEVKILAENGNLTFIARTPDARQLYELGDLFGLYIPALFLGGIVYVGITARKTHIASRRESVSTVSDSKLPTR